MSEIEPSPSGQNGKEILPDTIIIHTNGVIRFINPAGLRLFGFSSADEVVGKDIYKFVRPEDHEPVKERIRQIEAEEIFQSPLKQMKLLHRDGTILDAEVTAVCANYKGLPAVMSIVIDISTRKEKEEEQLRKQTAEYEILYRQAEEKAIAAGEKARGLETILDSIAEGIAMYDISGKVIWVNPGHVTLIGGDMTGLTWNDWKRKFQQMSFRYPDGWLVSEEEYPAIRALRGDTFSDEVLIFNNLNNMSMTVSVSGRPLIEAGKIIGAVVVMQDITERERKLSAIRASHKKSTDILESINDGFLFIDHEWRISYANRRLIKALGLTGDDIGFKCIWDKFPQLFDSEIGKNLRDAMETKLPRRFEFTSRLTDRWYLATVYPAVSGISIYVIDMTNR